MEIILRAKKHAIDSLRVLGQLFLTIRFGTGNFYFSRVIIKAEGNQFGDKSISQQKALFAEIEGIDSTHQDKDEKNQLKINWLCYDLMFCFSIFCEHYTNMTRRKS